MMQNDAQNNQLTELLADNPDVLAAWIDRATPVPTLRILTRHAPAEPDIGVLIEGHFDPVILPKAFAHYRHELTQHALFTDLRLRLPVAEASNQHQRCQNEPIQLGTQIQPAKAKWVGTAGAPVKWLDDHGRPHWGILSNAHVMCRRPDELGTPIHQPTDAKSAIGHLADYSLPTAAGVWTLDAAIADCEIDGLHSIANDIIGIDPTSTPPMNARSNLSVIKSGRTTGVTTGNCEAIGAAVKVSYGSYTATFVDQDLFRSRAKPFSAPGDSGSCIFSRDYHAPCSLLFAGGGGLTIGCPIRYAVERFNLVFPFN